MSKHRFSLFATLWLPLLLAASLAVACGNTPEPGIETPTKRPSPTRLRGTATALATWTAEPVTPTATATATATPTPIIYAIQQGDTLLDVAIRFNVSASEIQEVNGITDPRTLQIGQQIIIPSAQEAVPGGTPTPTPMPVHVLSMSYNRTSLGDVVIVGEVVNENAQGVEEVNIKAELRDAQGQSAASSEVYALQDVIAAGDKAPFVAVFNAAPAYASVDCRVVRAMPEAPERAVHRRLNVSEVSGRAVYDRTFVVIGKVRNTSSSDAASDIYLVVTLYGSDGTVIGAKREPLSPALAPGEFSLFEISIVPVAWPVANYKVTVEGRQAQPSPTPEVTATASS